MMPASPGKSLHDINITNTIIIKETFSYMDRDEITQKFSTLYDEYGAVVFTCKWLKENRLESLYSRALYLKIYTKDLAHDLNVADELKQITEQFSNTKITDKQLDDMAKTLISDHGCIPSVTWLEANGYAGMYNVIMQRGGIHSFREKYHTQEICRTISRDGQRWDSQAEVCCCNFLWARGIEVSKGKFYPKEYAEFSGKAYGKYDMHFTTQHTEYKVEIWGADRMTGHGGTRYEDTKKCKQLFHKDDPTFIEIPYNFCYTEAKLQLVLGKIIGDLPVLRFGNESDKLFPPSTWTLSDEVIKKCRFVCQHVKDGILPPGDWFYKTKTFKNRPRLDWEPETWGRLPDNITKLGGFPKIRQILNQVYVSRWDRQTTLRETAEFYKKYKAWPPAVERQLKRKAERTPEEIMLSKTAGRLVCAARKYVGGQRHTQSEARRLLD